MKTRIAVSLLLLALLFQKTSATNIESNDLDCIDFQTSLVGNIFGMLATKSVKSEIQTKLLLATKKNPVPVRITNVNYSNFSRTGLDAFKKTYIIIHGYQNDAYAEWIAALKKELLKTVDVNIIIVNWDNYSYRWNYLNAVRAMPKVRNDIFTALQDIKRSFKLSNYKRIPFWNHLYFIGHSLGAHLSGQIAYLLEKDNFYRVERITGLDPARPCFSYCHPNLKLDKSHAEFVDVIHTQTGTSFVPDSFGAVDPLGHADFYVNGGAMQPECEGLFFSELKKQICSHGIATDYFLESIKNFRTKNTCRFVAYKWDRTYINSLKILDKIRESESCLKCPEMGFGASKDKGTGTFLVFTGITTPHCRFSDSQSDYLLLGKSLARLNVKNTVEDPYEKYYLPDGNNKSVWDTMKL